MFNWIKSWWCKGKEPEKVVIPFTLPDGKRIEVEALRNPLACKKHPEYVPVAPPTNNCNGCWEYYSQNNKGHWL
jgi:hypothetical protein